MSYAVQTILEDLQRARQEAERLIAAALNVDQLRQAESKLTAKDGLLGRLVSSIKQLPGEVRAAVGKEINLGKKAVEQMFAEARAK